MRLTVTSHERDVAGMKYVYPVVSRRAEGVSVGVNLSPNNACNFRCIYCQVPGLVYGKAPLISIGQLESELASMLERIIKGDFLRQSAPEGRRRLNDVALSGNGEPTGSPQFLEAVRVIARVLDRFNLTGSIKLVLITNGTLIHRREVLEGLAVMNALNGEVWFKLDSVVREGFRRINSTPLDPERHIARLRRAAELCPTWIQTCLFALSGAPPPEPEQRAYIERLQSLVRGAVPVRGVQLYALVRPSRQPEAGRISALPKPWMEGFARQVESTGLRVQLVL